MPYTMDFKTKGVVACDFLCVDTVFWRRLYVLIFIERASRRLHLAGITTNPTGEWVTRRAGSWPSASQA